MPNKFCILLAACNGEKFISPQLHSILNQKNILTKTHISIDPSIDNTIDTCNSFSVLYTNVSYGVSSNTINTNAAGNFFTLLSEHNFSFFNYIAFSDQDDVWHENKLSRAVAELQRTGADGYSSNVTAFWTSGKTKLIDKAQAQVEWDYLFESAGPGCTFVLTQALALKLQDFIRNNKQQIQSVWMHDWFIYAFARGNGYAWTIDSQSTMQYRQHASNVVGVNDGMKAALHRVKKVFYGDWFNQVGLLATLIGKHETPFVKSWFPFTRIGFFKLALKAHKCRRKRSEQLVFFCLCIIKSIIGHKAK